MTISIVQNNATLRRLVNRLGESGLAGRLLPYTPLDIPPEQWERQYADGHWQRLEHIHELPRYGAVAAYCREAAPGPAVLDIGCGEGLLLRHLTADHETHYLGIDISVTAIEAARRRYRQATFLTTNVQQYQSGERFDAIVFNECIYCFSDPVALLTHFTGMLTNHGIIVVSCYDSPRTRKVWKQLQRFNALDTTRIHSERGTSWTIKLFAETPAYLTP